MYFFEMKVKSAETDTLYGDVHLYEDGTLCISMYDGMTKLTPEEANTLGTALQSWAKTGGKHDLG